MIIKVKTTYKNTFKLILIAYEIIEKIIIRNIKIASNDNILFLF